MEGCSRTSGLLTLPRPPRACHAPGGSGGAGIRRFECSCKLSGHQQLQLLGSVALQAIHFFLQSPTCFPLTRVILVSKVFFLVKNKRDETMSVTFKVTKEHLVEGPECEV